MSSQEAEAEAEEAEAEEAEADVDPPIIFGRGTTQQYFSFSTTTRFYDVKQKRNYSALTSRSIAATD